MTDVENWMAQMGRIAEQTLCGACLDIFTEQVVCSLQANLCGRQITQIPPPPVRGRFTDIKGDRK